MLGCLESLIERRPSLVALHRTSPDYEDAVRRWEDDRITVLECLNEWRDCAGRDGESLFAMQVIGHLWASLREIPDLPHHDHQEVWGQSPELCLGPARGGGRPGEGGGGRGQHVLH